MSPWHVGLSPISPTYAPATANAERQGFALHVACADGLANAARMSTLLRRHSSRSRKAWTIENRWILSVGAALYTMPREACQRTRRRRLGTTSSRLGRQHPRRQREGHPRRHRPPALLHHVPPRQEGYDEDDKQAAQASCLTPAWRLGVQGMRRHAVAARGLLPGWRIQHGCRTSKSFRSRSDSWRGAYSASFGTWWRRR
jgi:hypothetical protein